MPHPFFKKSAGNGVPSHVSPGLWDRLKKVAHGVWSVEDSGEGPTVVRHRADTAKLDRRATDAPSQVLEDGENSFSAGDLVLLFMGGQRVMARVKRASAGLLDLTTGDGEMNDVPSAWVRKADPAPLPPSRTKTREDIPVVDPNAVKPQTPLDVSPEQKVVVEEINRALAAGGKIGLRISPSTILVIQSNGRAVTGQILHVSTQVVNNQSYPSVEHMVRSLGITGYPEFVDPNLLK